jgi:PAS domain S-box-containing protein
MNLRILHIDDSPKDTELVQETIAAEGIRCTIDRIDVRDRVLRAVRSVEYDIILCDYNLPAYSGMEALLDVRDINPSIPFIFVSGSIGEAHLIEALRLGATDYVLKTELSKLVPSIQRALREVEEAQRRKLAEEARLASEESYRIVAETAKDGIVTTDEAGIILFANPAMGKIFGYMHDELPGKSLTTLIPGYLYRLHGSLLSGGGTQKEGSPLSDEAHLVGLHRDGTEIPLEISFGTFEKGGRQLFTGIVRDISDRKRAQNLQQALYRIAQAADSSTRLDDLFRAIHAIIKEIMPAENFYIALYDERQGILTFPYFVDEVDEPSPPMKPGKGLTEYVLRTGQSVLCDQVLHKDLARRGEIELVGADSPIWLGVPLVIEKKTIGAMVVQHYSDAQAYGQREKEIFEYISSQVARVIDRKQSEEKLRKTTADLLLAQRIGKTGSWFADLIKNTLEWSDEVYRIFGRDPASFTPTNEAFFASVHPDDRNAVVTASEDSIRAGTRYEVEHRIVLPDGGIRVLYEQAEIVRNEQGKAVAMLGVVQDITERKQTAAALKKSEEAYRSFFEDDLTGDFVATPDGRLLACNHAFVRIFGFPSLDMALSVNLLSLYNDSAEYQAMLAKLSKERKLEYHELEMVRCDGSHALIVANFIGRFNANGDLCEVKGYLFDDSKRRQLEHQLIQAQKLESLGTLAGGIAHDFNNILGIIMGHAALLRDANWDLDRRMKSGEVIAKAAERGAALVRQLLAFARKSDVTLQSVNVNDLVNETARLIDETFPEMIVLSTDAQHGLPSIHADPSQLNQVLLNLCVNARDAMDSHGGTLTIGTRRATADELRDRFPHVEASEYVQLFVADTGEGMSETTRARLFEPFFTTKEIGKGTGLGLATVYGIVESHHGFIDVESELGSGTTFRVYFPVPPRTTEALSAGQTSVEDVKGGSEAILFVEDEEMLSELVNTILTGKGYRVFTACNGQEALQVYLSNHKEISLVITDLGMPRLGGESLIVGLKEIDHSVKVIVASGHLDAEIQAKLMRAGAQAFIQKPFKPRGLLETVRNVLDGA